MARGGFVTHKTSTKPPTGAQKTHEKYPSWPFGGQGKRAEPQ